MCQMECLPSSPPSKIKIKISCCPMTPALFGSTLIRKAKECDKCKQHGQDNNVAP